MSSYLNSFLESIDVDNNSYTINGISKAQCLGGVEAARGASLGDGQYYLKFTNHNNFITSVIFEVISSNGGKRTGTIVLKPNETKETTNRYFYPENFILIARKLTDNFLTIKPPA